jgi:hypothetical protein
MDNLKQIEKILKIDSDIQSEVFDLSEKVDVIEDKITNIEYLKGEPGNDGLTPIKGTDYFTREEIETIKREVTPIKGKDYSDGTPGKTPTKEELEALIIPLIPELPIIELPDTSSIASDASKMALDELKPFIKENDTPKEIKLKLESLKGDNRLDASAIKNLPTQYFHTGGGGGGLSVSEVNALIAAATGKGSIITATDSGDHTIYNLASPITSTNYYAIINNGMYTPDDPGFPFTVVASTLTFSSALPDDLASTLIKIVCV